MALILPLLLLIIVGITEVGLYFKEYLTVSHASREGSRVDAFAGNSTDADCQILMAVGEVLGIGNIEDVDRIEIFKADQSPARSTDRRSRRTMWPSSCVAPGSA